MFNLKLAFLAVLLIIGCVVVHAQQDNSNEAAVFAAGKYVDEVPQTKYDEAVEAESEESEIESEVESVAEPEEDDVKAVDEVEKELRSNINSNKKHTTTTTTTGKKGSKGTTTTTTGKKGSTTTTTTGKKGSTTTTTTGKKASTTTTSTTGKKASTTTTSTTGKKASSTTGSSSSSSDLCAVTSTDSEPLQLLVPLYVYPGSDWDTVATAAAKVGVIAIINPNSGPDTAPDSSYTTYMKKLNTAGVIQVGYVYTSFGERVLADAKADIDTYASKYSYLSGIFFDEVSGAAADVTFYTELYNYVLSKGWSQVILNPGTQPTSAYSAISSNIVVFEDQGSLFSGTSFDSWVTCAPTSAAKSGYKYKFSAIAHTTASSSAPAIIASMAKKGMGLVYTTDGAGGCCTYNTLVSYFASETTSVVSLN